VVAYCLVQTALGSCAVGWTAVGLVAVELPRPTAQAARSALLRRHPQAVESEPTGAVRAAVDGIVALLAGEPVDFAEAPLDLTGVGEFELRVYALARTIPPGATLTYGELARRLGDPGAAQAVGRALARNPVPIVVPCHRITAAGGRPGGFSGAGGVDTKMRLLAVEGAAIDGQPLLF
jgi:methylated-DNA-[protein]-cysteine S-methyltransferase